MKVSSSYYLFYNTIDFHINKTRHQPVIRIFKLIQNMLTSFFYKTKFFEHKILKQSEDHI